MSSFKDTLNIEVLSHPIELLRASRLSPSPKIRSVSSNSYLSWISWAVCTSPPEHVWSDAVADITAVVPTSQITLDVTAAQEVLGNKAAPIPQSVYGLAEYTLNVRI